MDDRCTTSFVGVGKPGEEPNDTVQRVRDVIDQSNVSVLYSLTMPVQVNRTDLTDGVDLELVLRDSDMYCNMPPGSSRSRVRIEKRVRIFPIPLYTKD